jgi:hypothetical protein
MNRPPYRDFLLGHRASTVLTSSAAGVAGVACLAHAVSWLVPVFALYVCGASFAARKRVTIYRKWRGAWDAMADDAPQPLSPAPRTTIAALPGPAPSPEAAPKPVRVGPSTRAQVVFIAWLLLLYYLGTHTSQGGTTFYGAATLLWTGWTGLVFVLLVVRYIRQALGFVPPIRGRDWEGDTAAEAPGNDAGEFIVAQCLPVARVSPPSGRVRDVLPDYCRALLERSNGR